MSEQAYYTLLSIPLSSFFYFLTLWLSMPHIPHSSSRSHKAEVKFNVTTECKPSLIHPHPFPYLFIRLSLSYSSSSRPSRCCCYRKHRSRKIRTHPWSAYQLSHRRRFTPPCCLFRRKRHCRKITYRQRCRRKRSKVQYRPLHSVPLLSFAAYTCISFLDYLGVTLTRRAPLQLP